MPTATRPHIAPSVAQAARWRSFRPLNWPFEGARGRAKLKSLVKYPVFAPLLMTQQAMRRALHDELVELQGHTDMHLGI